MQLFDFSTTHAHLSVPVDGGRGEAGDVTPELEPVPLPDPHLSRATRLYPRRGGHWIKGRLLKSENQEIHLNTKAKSGEIFN